MNHPLFNRIRKNLKQLKPFLKQHYLSCYRVYDWDMPEFPLCIDRYGDFLHIAEYKTRFVLQGTEYSEWLNECRMVLEQAFELPPDHLIFKRRERMKEQAQYEKVAERKEFITMEEHGLKFNINLYDYLDTGLFLDHRPLRRRVRSEASGKNVLNLFAYTGSISVYAAAGGASGVTTVDLSNTYLQWARENFVLNQLDPEKYAFIRADVKDWLKKESAELYDLIVLDPPTVSKSKMVHSSFDIQRDHPEMIFHVLRRLKPGGVLYFSTNFREFRLMTQRIQAHSIEDITLQTIDPDFRNQKIHYCWKIVR
ncbi:MAG TPA: class I SAM-dependent methyltransferase [Chitinophagaceae bacterium]|nr:class I SAM-dependent methyltransferase [Chitinophagaceae bacterium]